MTTPNHAPLIKRLLLPIALMFGFAFALVPLYDLFCQATGLNGKTASRPADQPARQIDGRREIRVEFLAHTAPLWHGSSNPG
ncbi:cytochrome C oxidase assembly protein [Aeromonas schubertii]|uniref:Cytochrome C oxidase assembly protein n=1 Tax=Aeromonas schubertii TaxID=652 RepID=A0A0S2SHW8_9GAMM|nr:cytochrome C oxidase assembly protein [Aeromonas schubertii]